MKRRTMIGLAAAGAVGLVTAAGAAAFGGPGGGRAGIMKRMATAALDEALDGAQVTPAQRSVVYGARDRVFAVLEEARASRQSHLDEALRLFEADQVDPVQVEALHRQGDEARQRIHDAIHQALTEVHDALTPAQRKALADYVRAHRMGHGS